MKRFRFPLNPVKVVRAQAKQRAQEQFAQAVHAYVESEETLASTRERVARLEQEMRAGRGAGIRAADAAFVFATYRREAAAEVESEQKMIAARAEMEKRRGEYLEAHRRLEVVNRLETKARTVYRLEASREEQVEFDELAGRRHSARQTRFAL